MPEIPPDTGSKPSLTAHGLSLQRGGRMVIDRLSLDIPQGRITALIGPNGCGKSTLLAGLARILRPREGEVLLDGRAIHRLPSRALARRLGLLPQQPEAPGGLSVRDLVAMGRHPHRPLLAGWSAQDEEAVARALDLAQLGELAARPLETLSGGQRQRVWIAMILAQQTRILLLDEPTTFLDIGHQSEVLDIMRQLNAQDGTTIVAALHDLGQAARHADHLVVMADGAVVAEGPPEDVLTPGLIERVYGVRMRIFRDGESGLLVCLPLGRAGS